jgi:rhodanese-related sulfurtransferase
MSSKMPNTEMPNAWKRGRHGYVRSLFLRILAILAIAVAIGFLNILANPKSPKYGKGMIRAEEIPYEKLPYNDNIVWVDARSTKDYEAGHVKNAVPINEDSYYIQLSSIVVTSMQSKTLIVYCASDECSSSVNIVRLIKKDTGLKNVYALKGGWETIKAHEIPIISIAEEKEIAQQKIEEEKAREREAVARAAAKELIEGSADKTSGSDNQEGEE